jgi:predicted MFS family arabinose efflux permease
MGGAHRFIDFISGNILSGSGQAAQHPIGTSIITRKFPGKSVSRALAIHYGLGYVGNIISPLLLSIISVAMGWRTATYFLAVIPLITGLTVLFYLKGEKSALKNTLSNKKISLWKDIKSVFQNKGVILIIAAQAFAVGGTGMGVIITYTPLFLKNALNIEILETSVIYSIAVLGGVLGTIMFGHLASKLGNLKMAAIVVGTCSISILLLFFHNSYTFFLVPHLFIIGVTSFASGSLLQAYLASISTTRQRDIVIGLYFTVSSGISSIWTTLTGFLIDFYGSFNPAWIFRAILGISAFSLIAWTLHQNQ